MLEEYKKDLKIRSKKAFTMNFDYKTKMQAIKDLGKKDQELGKDRAYFIINIEHQFIRNVLVIFHLKITEMAAEHGANQMILLKGANANQKKYTVDLELNVLEKNIEEVVKDFCVKQKIHMSDEISLSNYIYSIVEAQRIAIESKKLILEIQNFKVDDILNEMKDKNLL